MIMSELQIVTKLFDKAKEYELNAPVEFWNSTLDELVKYYNGTGPEWMIPIGRKALDWIMEELLEMVLIHDFRFSFSDGTFKGFMKANNEMLQNGFKIVSIKYKWYSVKRYYYYKLVLKAWRFCVMYGWLAWKQACKNKG